MRERATVVTSLASGVDRLFASVALGRSRRSRARSRAESLGHDERMDALARLIERHAAPRFTAPPEELFGRAGEAGAWLRTPVRAIRGGTVVDVRWRSGYRPLAEEPDVLARWERDPANAWAHARLFLHPEPRPTALLIHGYLGGSYAVEERAWPVRWMFERLGLDLAIPVLPFHGPRRSGGRPMFPSSDPRLNVEGFRQAIWDLVSLRRALAACGAPAVGITGMSLGGYTTALALTADPAFAFGAPFIPLASIADFARDGGRLVGDSGEQDAQHAALEAAHAPVSPLLRRPLVPGDAVRVVAARADRITPVRHAERLAAHFDAELTTFEGGHLLQLGRAEGFRDIARLLRARGLLESAVPGSARAARDGGSRAAR